MQRQDSDLPDEGNPASVNPVNPPSGSVSFRDNQHIEISGDLISGGTVNVYHAAGLPARAFQFQPLIDEATKDFVGREYIFAAIDAFVTHQPQGYITIEGDPGMGKTALLAQYVQQTHCIAYFNDRLAGRNRAVQFLESVCRQLIERYQLPHATLPRNATADGSFLLQLLDEISSQLAPGQQLVIAVDALDEVELATHTPGANLLYLPERLPAQVYFLLTRRRMSDPHLRVRTPQLVLNLVTYHAESQRDIQIYIQRLSGGRAACTSTAAHR